jgi:hypothetical protein
MPPKRVVQQPRETFKDASNLSANENFTSSSASASSFQSIPRTGYLPTLTVIDPDHTNKRMNPDLPKTDSLVLLSDGDAPSPISPIGFIPTSDGPASYSTFVRQTREQTRELRKLTNVSPTQLLKQPVELKKHKCCCQKSRT